MEVLQLKKCLRHVGEIHKIHGIIVDLVEIDGILTRQGKTLGAASVRQVTIQIGILRMTKDGQARMITTMHHQEVMKVLVEVEGVHNPL